MFWKDANGAAPAPFTPIAHADVVSGKWVPADEALKEYAEEYTRQLEASSGKFQHIIWPEHCLIGSPGHCVVPPVLDGTYVRLSVFGRQPCSARRIPHTCHGMSPYTRLSVHFLRYLSILPCLYSAFLTQSCNYHPSFPLLSPPYTPAIHAWSAHARKPIHYYWKGTNIRTEMYSVFKAEVPVPGCAETAMNEALVRELVAEPRVLICGQALSHCVNFSTRDLLAAWPDGRMNDLGLLAGMSSPVAGFEKQADEFVAMLKEKGVSVVVGGQK